MRKPTVPISIRIDTDIVQYFRAGGRGWQTRLKAVLRQYKRAMQRKERRDAAA